MYKINRLVIIVVLILFTLFTVVAAKASDISVIDGYIRASIPGASNSSAYMTINNNNNEKTVTLVKVTSKISLNIEMHNHIMKNGMMHMEKLQKIDIDANSKVLLQPHGLHLMVFNLVEPLNSNDVVEVTLHFSDKRTVIVPLPVQSLK